MIYQSLIVALGILFDAVFSKEEGGERGDLPGQRRC